MSERTPISGGQKEFGEHSSRNAVGVPSADAAVTGGLHIGESTRVQRATEAQTPLQRQIEEPAKYPMGMQKLLANAPELSSHLRGNAVVNNETLLINFYAAQEYGTTVEAYDTFVRAPLNMVIGSRARWHGGDWVGEAVPVARAILRDALGKAERGSEEHRDLSVRLDSLNRFSPEKRTQRGNKTSYQ